MGLKLEAGMVENLVGTQDTRGHDGQRARVIDGGNAEKEDTTLNTTVRITERRMG